MPDKDYDWGAHITTEWFEPAIDVMSREAEVFAQRCLKDFWYDFLMKCTPEEIEELKEGLKKEKSDAVQR